MMQSYLPDARATAFAGIAIVARWTSPPVILTFK
jgi:hypothetical protein